MCDFVLQRFIIQSQVVRPASVSLKATEWNTWFSCTRLTQFKNTIYTHIESSVPFSEERESHRDRYQSWSSIILLDGLGVTLIQAKWVEFLQGYSWLHAMKQNKKHAHGEHQSPQPPHDLVYTGMERNKIQDTQRGQQDNSKSQCQMLNQWSSLSFFSLFL